MKTQIVTVQTVNKPQEVEATLLKRVMVHRPICGISPWVITHIASGHKLPRAFATKAKALKVAHALDGIAGFDDIPINEIPVKGFGRNHWVDLRQSVKRVYDKFDPTFFDWKVT